MAKGVIPTGIESFDLVIRGGFPRGSVVLLMSEFQTDAEEFLITSAKRLSTIRSRDVKSTSKNIVLPKEIWWATLMRQGNDLLQETSSKFHPDFSKTFSDHVKFEDFFGAYVQDTPLLPREILKETIVEKRTPTKPKKDLDKIIKEALTHSSILLDALAKFFTKKAPGNMVVLDSLTDLTRLFKNNADEWNSFLLFLHWLRRSSKNWGGVVYTLFTSGLIEELMENELLLCFDDIISFRRQVSPQGESRTLSLRKFSGGVLPEGIGELQVKTTNQGLDIEKSKIIERLK